MSGLPSDEELAGMFIEAFQKKQIDRTVEPTTLVSKEPIKGLGIENSGIEADGANGVLVPTLTADELASNTPANGKPLVRVKHPKGIGTETFLTLLSNAYALYLTEGSYDNERLQRRTGIAPGIIAKTLASPEFTTALRVRGVSPEATGLTREQELCVQVLTDPSDGKTLRQKLDLLKPHGVTYAKYKAWLKNPTFRAYINGVSEDLLANNQDALVQLERLVGEGDLGAIKYKLEVNGRYSPQQQQNIDMMAMMGKVVEIISYHVRDPEVLRGVAGDLNRLSMDLKTNQIGR